jgi:ATP-dependent Clp protease adaptor protein ClpS
MPQFEEKYLGEVIEELKEPKMYKVVLLNDDYTTMDFVVMVLMVIFHKSLEEAQKLMLKIHKSGKAVCGVYTFEVAETKVAQVDVMAEKHQYPLRCTLEEE